MGLKEYRAKRTFAKTPEPKGKAAAAGRQLRFVVQKHHASRLHYDFRLELDGVLKSWAVPKGPSLSPEDKRLAMQVEDHPFEYRDCEGIIPEGNYGAGTVMVWDEGTYESYEESDPAKGRKALLAGLAKGDLKFTLHGQKLNGSYALVQMKGRGDKNWLLIKKHDDFATADDVTKDDRSAKTGRTLDEIAAEAGPGETWTSPAQVDLTGIPKGRFPTNVKPMLTTLVKEPFDRPGWLFEIKWDGYRAVGQVRKGTVKLYSRNGLDFTDRYAPVAEELAALGHDAVLDGEIVAVDDAGRSRFQLLQQFQSTGQGNLVYYVFDLLHLDGRNLTNLPLTRRKEILAELLAGARRIRLSEHVEEQGTAFFEAAKRQGLEGIVAKDGASHYLPGRRGSAWLKIKSGNRQEAVIGGFTEPRGSRSKFGALVLGVYDDRDGGKLRYIGHTGTGFDERTLEAMAAKLKPLIRKTSPFADQPKTNTPATWVSPKLVCEVAFEEWTNDGHLRQPVFVGLREDKPATSVRREIKRPAGKVLKGRTR